MVVCGPSQCDEIVQGFEEEGFEVEVTKMDDKVPWAGEEDTLSARAIKAIFKGVSSGQDLLEKTKGMFRA